MTTIGRGAFHSNKLTNIFIPNNVTVIDSYSFMNNQLTSVTIPGSITKIGREAFSRNQLTSVKFSNGLTTIGPYAFEFNQIKSVTIPSSVTSIQEKAFTSNPLTSITIIGTETRNHGIDSFDNNFNDFYEKQGRKPGTYTLNNGRWSFERSADSYQAIRTAAAKGIILNGSYVSASGITTFTFSSNNNLTIKSEYIDGITGENKVDSLDCVYEINNGYLTVFYSDGTENKFKIEIEENKYSFINDDGDRSTFTKK